MVINRWLSFYKPKVARPFFDEAKMTYPGLDFVVDDPGARGVNPHELLAIGRIVATVQGIALLALDHTGNGVQAIDFLWGANRDLAILATLNRALQAAGFAEIEGHLIGDHVLAADQHRRPVAPQGAHSEYGMMVNVYCHGQDASEVNPMWLGALGYRHLVWIGHRFDNMYGAILSAHWLRVPSPTGPLIRWYADEVNPEYPPHPPCDLMHASGATAGHQWHAARLVNCNDQKGATRQLKALYDVVLVSARLAREAMLCAVRETPQIVVEMEVPDFTGVQAWITASCPRLAQPTIQWLVQTAYDTGVDWWAKTKVTVQKGDFHAAVRFLSNKGRQQYSFRALQTEVDRFLSDPTTHGDFIYLESRAPDYFLHYRWNLTIAAFTYRAQDQAWQMRNIQATYAPAFETSNRATKGLDVPLAPAAGHTSMYLAGVIAVHFALASSAVGPWYRSAIRRVLGPVVRVIGGAFGLASGSWAQKTKEGAICAIVAVRDFELNFSDRVVSLLPETSQLEIKAIVTKSFEDAKELAVAAKSEALIQEPRLVEYAVGVCVVAPLLEEGYKQLAKKMFGRKGQFLASCVAAADDLTVSGGGVYEFWARVGLHYWFSSGTFWGGVKTHSIWNAVAISVKLLLNHRPSAPRAPVASGTWGVAAAALLALAMLNRRRRQQPPALPPPVVAFDERWYAHPGPVQNRQELFTLEQERSITAIPEGHRYVPPFSAAQLPAVPRDPTVHITCHPTPFAAPQDNIGNGYFRIWGHNAPMFRPAGSTLNMQAVVTHRLAVDIAHRAEPGTWWYITCLFAGQLRGLALADWPLPSAHDLRFWSYVDSGWPTIPTYEPLPCGIEFLDRPHLVEAWLAHTDPAKRERYVEAMAAVQFSPLSVASKKVCNLQVNVKKDEVLMKYRLKDADMGAIPRPIHNVDPMLAVSIGPDVYAASTRVKHAWNWKHQQASRLWQTNGKNLTLTYGAGLLAHELDEWFAHSISTLGWHIIVAGDDSVVIRYQDGRLLIIEGDISKCDHSIRLEALMFEYRVLVAAGIAPEVCRLLLANSSATCVAGSRQPDGGSVRLQRSAERNTGGVDTTVGNTVVTGGIHALACVTCASTNDAEATAHFATVFASAGLALKSRVWSGPAGELGSSFYGPSFLKGYWYPTSGNPHWQWGPLPSRMLKISKIMVDPRRVYHLAGEAQVDYALAASRHVASLYLGLSPYVWPSELLNWLHARADPAWSKKVAVEEWTTPWRPQAARAPDPVLQAWRAQAAWWYGVSEEDILDWLDHIGQLNLLQFSCHPFWATMAMRDYN